jgi:very-short-patch-repair endonuclease
MNDGNTTFISTEKIILDNNNKVIIRGLDELINNKVIIKNLHALINSTEGIIIKGLDALINNIEKSSEPKCTNNIIVSIDKDVLTIILDYLENNINDAYVVDIDVSKLYDTGCRSNILCKNMNCSNCYYKSLVVVEYIKYYQKCNGINPRFIHKGSEKKYIFYCKDCKHYIEKSPESIKINERACLYCSKQILCNVYFCYHCYPRSFAANPKSKLWSKENTITAREICISSGKKIILSCDKCPHDYLISPNNVNRGRGCPYCSGSNLCEIYYCFMCLPKSFVSHEKSKCLSLKNKVDARQIFMHSDTKYIFQCDKCPHEFEKSPASIVSKNSWCPYCASKKLCVGELCMSCYNKSLRSNPDFELFSSKNTVSCRMIFKGSKDKYLFYCPDCKEDYLMSAFNFNAGQRCTCMLKKTETKLYKFFTNNTKYKVLREERYDWCTYKDTQRKASYDFIINEYNLIIELDGRQHFENTYHHKEYTETTNKDVYKMKCAMENGYKMIRILQENVWQDKNDWKSKLLRAIEYIINSNINFIFIDNKNMYQLHINLLGISKDKYLHIN